MKEYDLIVVGAGIAGMTASIEALRSGVENVLILERENCYGGVLNQCIHCGFKVKGYDELVTGPEYIEIAKNSLDKFEYELKLKSSVLEINENKEVKYVSESDGINTVKGKAIVISTGCRERYTGNILIPTSKFTGVFTIGNAHKFINVDGVLPGKYPVIIANSKWALILARRIELEGGKVQALVINAESEYKLNEEDKAILDGFDIPILENSKLIEVSGNRRVGSVKVVNLDTEECEEFDCDSLMLSVGYYPEIDIVRSLNLEMNDKFKSIKVNESRTSIDGIFACGNVIYGNYCIEKKDIHGYIAGKEAHKFLNKLV